MHSEHEKSVRELAGEVWAEITAAKGNEHREVLNEFVDILLGVLARHAGATIVNDSDLPVTPLPKK